jgi:hypothetical protein
LKDCLNTVAEPENKVAVFEYMSKFLTIHNNHREYYRSGVSSIKILEERVETYFEVFIFMPSNPFFDYFNQIMAELAAGGFLSYWRKLEINPKGIERKIDKIGPQVLTMEHLMIGFVVCLVPCAIGATTFVFEITFKRLMRTNVTKASKVSTDKTVGRFENIEQFQCQTIENTESTNQFLSRSNEGKLDNLKLFEIESLENRKSNRKGIRNGQDSFSILSFQ